MPELSTFTNFSPFSFRHRLPVYKSTNRPLRDEERKQRGEGHPLPATVAFIADGAHARRARRSYLGDPFRVASACAPYTAGVKKLRSVQAVRTSAHDDISLWRGMRDMQVSAAFLKEGGTEIAPMSSTTDMGGAPPTSLPISRHHRPLRCMSPCPF